MVRNKVVALDKSGSASLLIAKDLVSSATFWIDHRQGIIHPEPGWADRIEKGPHGWEVRFGGKRSNKFLVERAIKLSRDVMFDELDRCEAKGETIDDRLLTRRLITCVRKSTADYSDSISDYYTGGAEQLEKHKGFYTDEAFVEGEVFRYINQERF